MVNADSTSRIVKPDGEEYDDLALEQLMNGLVRTKLGIDAAWGDQSGRVFGTLRTDFMKPVTKGGSTFLSVKSVKHTIYQIYFVLVENLLNNTDVQVYVVTGQLDLIVDTPGNAIIRISISTSQSYLS